MYFNLYIYLIGFKIGYLTYIGRWREMILVSAIIPAGVLYGSLTLIEESPRFLIYHHRYLEARDTINVILKLNVIAIF